MKLHLFNLLLLIITICFFQSTHEYRLSKRQAEITEYDLATFIASTCSEGQTDPIIRNLCDQTFQSAVMGTFPFMIGYCKSTGAGMSFCHNINLYVSLSQNLNQKQSVERRHVPSYNEEKDLPEQMSQMDYKIDFEFTSSMQTCMKKIEEQAADAFEHCNRTLQERYSDIARLCENYPDFDYCRLVRFPSSFYFWLLSSGHSLPTKVNPLIFSSSKHKTTNVNANNDQQSINTNKQERSSSLSS